MSKVDGARAGATARLGTGIPGTETSWDTGALGHSGWDVIRVAALGGVLLFHLTYTGSSANPGIPVASFAWRHSFGSAVLLITSGYFAAATLGTGTSGRWLTRRLAQLLPAYLLAVVLVFTLLRLFAPDDFDPGHLTYGDLIGNLLLLQQLLPNVNYVDLSWWIVPLQVIGFAAMALLARRKLGSRATAAVLWGVVVIPLVVNQVWLGHSAPLWLVMATSGTGLLQAHLLAIGVAIWLWSVRRMGTLHFVLLLATALIAERLEPPQTSVVLIGLMIGLMCLAARRPDWNLPGLRRYARPLRCLANCSYGIYLVHQSIGYLVEERLVRLGASTWLWMSAPFVIAVVLGWALTIGVQRPALRVLDRGARTPWQQLNPVPTAVLGNITSLQRTLALPKQRIYLHVGLAKTGTTYLQERLWLNRDALKREGLLYPGSTAQDQFRAACLAQPDRYPQWTDSDDFHDVWPRLIAEIRDWPGTSVLSHELFGSAGPEQAHDVLAQLSFAEIHIVCTVRDLARQVPSVWQENLKNGYTVSFPEFVTEISAGDPDNPRDLFWEFQDTPRILRTWSAGLAPERVHVIVVPPRGSEENLLWHRFARTLGWNAQTAVATIPRNNSSLDTVQSELLRRVNQQLRTDLSWAQYEKVVKGGLVEQHLRQTRRTRPLTLPDSARPWVVEHTERCIAEISARGYDVIGDLSELRPHEQVRTLDDDIDQSEVLAVAVETLVRLIETVPEHPQSPAASRAARIRHSIGRRAAVVRRE